MFQVTDLRRMTHVSFFLKIFSSFRDYSNLWLDGITIIITIMK